MEKINKICATAFLFFTLIFITENLHAQSVIKSRSWYITANLSSLFYGAADFEVEYITIRKISVWSVRLFRSFFDVAEYEGWRTLGMNASYRFYFEKNAPEDLYLGLGFMFVGVKNPSDRKSDASFGPKLELGYHIMLGRTVGISISSNLIYNPINEVSEGIPSGLLLNSLFPKKGLSASILLGISYVP